MKYGNIPLRIPIELTYIRCYYNIVKSICTRYRTRITTYTVTIYPRRVRRERFIYPPPAPCSDGYFWAASYMPPLNDVFLSEVKKTRGNYHMRSSGYGCGYGHDKTVDYTYVRGKGYPRER